MQPDYRKNRYSFTKQANLAGKQFDRAKRRFTLMVQVGVTCAIAGAEPVDFVTRPQEVLAIFLFAVDFLNSLPLANVEMFCTPINTINQTH